MKKILVMLLLVFTSSFIFSGLICDKKKCIDTAEAHVVYLRLTNSTGQLVPTGIGNFTSLSFDTVLEDTAGLYNTLTPTDIVIQEDGYYEIFGNTRYAANATGFRELVIRLNGLQWIAVQRVPVNSSTAPTILNPSTVRHLVAGDVLNLQTMHDAGINLNIGVGNEYTPIFGLILIHHRLKFLCILPWIKPKDV